MNWSPNQELLKECLQIITEAQSGSIEYQEKSVNWLNAFSQNPESIIYYSFLFACVNDVSVNVRAAAGILLKSVAKHVGSLTDEQKSVVCESLYQTMHDPTVLIRNNSTSAIPTIVPYLSEEMYQRLLIQTINGLDSTDNNLLDGCLKCLYKLLEDLPESLDPKINSPLPQLVQKWLYFINNSDNLSFKKISILSMEILLEQCNPHLEPHIIDYLTSLCKLANNTDLSIQALVCNNINEMLFNYPQMIESYIPELIQYMLEIMTKGDDDDMIVKIRSTEFFDTFCQICNEINRMDLLPPLFNKLLPILLQNMILTNDNTLLLRCNEDCTIPDKLEDLKPKFKDYFNESNKSGEQTEDDISTEWNLRTVSASTLDELSNVYSDLILYEYIPLFETTVKSEDPLTKELGILSLGTIAIGCGGMQEYMMKIFPYLINCMKTNNHPAVRSISYWTISRYIGYIVKDIERQQEEMSGDNSSTQLLQSIIEEILIGINDKNKLVEDYACSSLSEIIEIADVLILPYMDKIISYSTQAYKFYQLKNLRNLLDVTSTSCRLMYYNQINNKDYFNEIINQIYPLFKNDRNIDNNTFALILSSLSDIILCFGINFQEFASEIYQKCLVCIEKYINEEKLIINNNNNVSNEYLDIYISAISVIGSLISSLEVGMLQLLTPSNLDQFILNNIINTDISNNNNGLYIVKVSIGLLGDIVAHCYSYIVNIIPQVMNRIIEFIRVDYLEKLYFSISNNSIWVISELILKYKEQFYPYIEPTMMAFKGIIQHYKENTQYKFPERELIYQNLMIAVGRMCIICPTQEMSNLIVQSDYINFWYVNCEMIRDGLEKDHCCLGICLLLQNNLNDTTTAASDKPKMIIGYFLQYCYGMASWMEPPQDPLRQIAIGLFNAVKTIQGNNWMKFYNESINEEIRKHLNKIYGI